MIFIKKQNVKGRTSPKIQRKKITSAFLNSSEKNTGIKFPRAIYQNVEKNTLVMRKYQTPIGRQMHVTKSWITKGFPQAPQ